MRQKELQEVDLKYKRGRPKNEASPRQQVPRHIKRWIKDPVECHQIPESEMAGIETYFENQVELVRSKWSAEERDLRMKITSSKHRNYEEYMEAMRTRSPIFIDQLNHKSRDYPGVKFSFITCDSMDILTSFAYSITLGREYIRKNKYGMIYFLATKAYRIRAIEKGAVSISRDEFVTRFEDTAKKRYHNTLTESPEVEMIPSVKNRCSYCLDLINKHKGHPCRSDAFILCDNTIVAGEGAYE